MSSSKPPSPSCNASPAVSWLLQMLCCYRGDEGVDVLLRPSGDRRRELKLHLSAIDRKMLGELLDRLNGGGGKLAEPGTEPGTNPATDGDTPDVPDSADAPADEPDLTPLATDVLNLLRREGKPLLGKQIATRLDVRYGSWLRQTLAGLVEQGHVRHGKSGYRLAPDAPTDEEGCTDVDDDAQNADVT